MKVIPMDRLAALELFVRVVESGSFSAAARERRLSQPAASKQVAALERSLGVRLLHRTTRKVTPTDEGLAYYDRAREAVQSLREAAAAVRTREAGLGGTLHVATSVGFGRGGHNRFNYGCFVVNGTIVRRVINILGRK